MNLNFYRFMCYTLIEMYKISLLIFIFGLILEIFLYAQNAEFPPDEYVTTAPLVSERRTDNYFLDFINKKAYAAVTDEKQEKKILREKWRELLGIDIFYSYYKAKEIEEWISEKAKIEFFHIEGKPKFEDDQIKYIFSIKF